MNDFFRTLLSEYDDSDPVAESATIMQSYDCNWDKIPVELRSRLTSRDMKFAKITADLEAFDRCFKGMDA